MRSSSSATEARGSPGGTAAGSSPLWQFIGGATTRYSQLSSGTLVARRPRWAATLPPAALRRGTTTLRVLRGTTASAARGRHTKRLPWRTSLSFPSGTAVGLIPPGQSYSGATTRHGQPSRGSGAALRPRQDTVLPQLRLWRDSHNTNLAVVRLFWRNVPCGPRPSPPATLYTARNDNARPRLDEPGG